MLPKGPRMTDVTKQKLIAVIKPLNSPTELDYLKKKEIELKASEKLPLWQRRRRILVPPKVGFQLKTKSQLKASTLGVSFKGDCGEKTLVFSRSNQNHLRLIKAL